VTAFKNLNIWDGLDDNFSPEVSSITFDQNGITDLGGADTDALDLGGLYLIPGLIDAHVHLCLDPEVMDPLAHGRVPRDQQLKDMAHRAEQMLQAGITTARDLGAGAWLELELREQIANRHLPGPRLVCAGQPLTTPNGHCHFWGGIASDADSACEVLQRQFTHDVDLIKVMATGGTMTPDSKPHQVQFSVDLLKMIVASAAEKQCLVAAHCHGTQGIRNATMAGVRTIEHCSWVSESGWGQGYDDDLVTEIAQRGIWISPTVNYGWRRYSGAREQLLIDNFSRMRNAGVKFIASTDAGIPNVFHHQLPQALPVFAHLAGFNPVQVLKSATSDAAEAIGLGRVTGRIQVGYSADFMLLDRNPLDDLSALLSPIAVFARGDSVGAF